MQFVATQTNYQDLVMQQQASAKASTGFPGGEEPMDLSDY